VGRIEAAGRWRCLGRRFANRGSGRGFGINGFYILIWSQPEVSRLAICVRSSGRGLYWAEIGLFLMLGFVFHVFFPLGGVVLQELKLNSVLYQVFIVCVNKSFYIL
jgi:hypothetical protein